MFKDLDLLATYSTYENDIASEFYAPVLAESVKYDRAAAYFSAKALARYAQGIEQFARTGNTCRFIMSAEIDKDDFEQIKAGYDLRNKINPILISKLREDLSIDEERNISNLAYLISLNVIDIKIAFTEKGIFHDKFGIAEDEEGECICFRGSNNETAAAFESNYEAFDITCSWQASKFDYSKITKSKETFEKLWNNNTDHVFVSNIDDVVMAEISKYDKGRIILSHNEQPNLPNLDEEDCLILDYDEVLKLHINIADPKSFLRNKVYKLRLKHYVNTNENTYSLITFKDTLTYITFKKIADILSADSEKRQYRLVITDRLKKYIADKEFYINERARIGLDIKRKDPKLFDEFSEYKKVVDNEFIRPLREQQMWDSFFMYTMKRASNFSVPGSGKTSSVLGVFAYLHSKGLASKIVMVGPKNSFNSWVDEFELCFGNKLAIHEFNIQDYPTAGEKRTALIFAAQKANLVLLNYDCLRSCIDEAKSLIDSQTLLVFDEIHKIKAVHGRNAEKALELAENASRVIALTGTPIPNSYMDIYNFLHILYRNEYDDFFGFTPQELKSPLPAEMESINSKLQPFYCRTNKSQLNVPEANKDIIVSVDASAEENQLFDIICEKYAKNKLALIIRLLQLESNPKMLLDSLSYSDFSDILDIAAEPEDIDFVDYSNDVTELIESLEYTSKFNSCVNKALSLVGQNKSIIIWCIFKDSICRLENELQRFGIRVGSIMGETSMEDRQATLDAFKKGTLQVLITNPHTLAESVSLHMACHDAIYFEYSYNLVHLLQSKDRIHRLGLPKNQYTQYYYMQENFVQYGIYPFCLDEKILNRLNEKERIMLDAIDNDVLETGASTEEDLQLIFTELRIDAVN